MELYGLTLHKFSLIFILDGAYRAVDLKLSKITALPLETISVSIQSQISISQAMS